MHLLDRSVPARRGLLILLCGGVALGLTTLGTPSARYSSGNSAAALAAIPPPATPPPSITEPALWEGALRNTPLIEKLRGWSFRTQLTDDELKPQTEIGLQSLGIESLDGLEQLTRLRKLDCSTPHGGCGSGIDWNSISDLSPLAKLPMLEELELSEVGAVDLTPLTRCTRLQRLGLSRTRIDTLQPLAQCRYLHTLDIRSCEKLDATTIRHLPEIRTLYVSHEFELSQLATLPNLTELNIAGMYAFEPTLDLRKLRSLNQLAVLRIDGFKLEHPEALAALGNLKTLSLYHCKLRKLPPLGVLSELRSLDLRGNPLTGLDALASLTHLESLALGGSNGQESLDHEAIEKRMKQLGYQTRWGQTPPDMAPLGKLPSLKTLIVPEDPAVDWPMLPVIDEVAVMPLWLMPGANPHPARAPGTHPLRTAELRAYTLREYTGYRDPLDAVFPQIGEYQWVIFPNYGSTW